VDGFTFYLKPDTLAMLFRGFTRSKVMNRLTRALLRACLAALAFYAFPTFESFGKNSVYLSVQDDAARKFDEYEFLPTDDEAARLDAFFNELRTQHNMRGYIVGYHAPQIERGIFLRRVHGDKRYLTEARGLEPNRIIVLDGGYKGVLTIELWLVPDGAPPPQPTATVPRPRINYQASYKFDMECLECSPAANLDLYGLGEGLKFYADELRRQPNSRGLILVRPGRYVAMRRALSEARQAKKLLVQDYRINASRIVIKAGARDKDNVAAAEMWVVPRGAKLPTLARTAR